MTEIQALAALHALWSTVLVPGAIWSACRWPVLWARRLGRLLLALGVLGSAGLAAREVLTRLPQVTTETHLYLLQRSPSTVAILTCVPLLQITMAGLIGWLMARRRLARLREAPQQSTAAAVTVSDPRPAASPDAPAASLRGDDGS